MLLKWKFCFKRYTRDLSISTLENLVEIFTWLLHVKIAIQNFSVEVLLQFYIALYTIKRYCIYCHLPLDCFCNTPFGTCSSLCITLYFVVICVFGFASYSFTLSFLALNILHCSTVFAVIRFLVFILHILYLAFVSSCFEFLFQSFWNFQTIGY